MVESHLASFGPIKMVILVVSLVILLGDRHFQKMILAATGLTLVFLLLTEINTAGLVKNMTLSLTVTETKSEKSAKTYTEVEIGKETKIDTGKA